MNDHKETFQEALTALIKPFEAYRDALKSLDSAIEKELERRNYGEQNISR